MKRLFIVILPVAAVLAACAGPKIQRPPFDPDIFNGPTEASFAGGGAATLATTPPAGFGVYARVVDVGPGLCVVAATRDQHYLVYDAGHWKGRKCLEAVEDIVGDQVIDLMILSHSDADHLGDAKRIIDRFRVKTIVRSGMRRDTGTWGSSNTGIGDEATRDATVINLQTSNLVPGTRFDLGVATVTLVAGWGEWTAAGPTASERRNAISIVAKLSFGENSILLTGDTVGRRLTDPDDSCKDAEKFMVDNSGEVSIRSQVIIAPHHGGNNGSATCFVEAVDPDFVIFSAGHDHEHPTAKAANRYLANGVAIESMFRTDRDDDEGGFEWSQGAVPACVDRKGDDDVEILLPEQGTPVVWYALPDASVC